MKNDEVHEEDYEYLKKEVDSLAKETEARMWEIRRLRALVREQSTEIMVLKSLINRYFVLHVWADVEPSLHPVTAYADLITKAREMRKSDDEESSYYKLIITDGEVSVDTYTNDELDGEAEVNEQPVRYIVIEKQDPYFPAIVTDEEGTPKVFHSLRRAEEEAEDCQDAQIVEMHEPPAPYFTPEEAAGKWICAFDTMCRGWDCVRGSKGEKDDVPYLYNSKEEVEEDDFFDPDDDFAIPATEFIEGRKAVWGVDGLHITGIPIVIGYKIQGNDVVKAEEPEVKYNQIIRVAKAWQSNEYYPEDVDIIELILDFKDRLRLMEAQEKCKLYGYDYIAMRAGMGARLLSHDGELSEMRTDVEYFKCYKTGIYFYAQNKYDATCQIESEVMIVTEGLGIELPDHIEYEVPQQ